jgi:hypothetical protein
MDILCFHALFQAHRFAATDRVAPMRKRVPCSLVTHLAGRLAQGPSSRLGPRGTCRSVPG